MEDAFAKLGEVKNQLGKKGDEVKRLGIAIGENGELSFFAELEKVSEKQRERIEKAREEKRAEAKEVKGEAAEEKQEAAKAGSKGESVEELLAEKYSSGKIKKSTYLYAATTEALMLKIAAVDWDAIKEKTLEAAGGKFDFTA